jgi:large subunit ribosomal protein L17
MITLGRRGDISARRQAISFLRSKDIVHKLFAEVAPRFADRPGGYSRIVKLGPRQGDAAEMVYLELVDHQPAGTTSEKRPSAPDSAAAPIGAAARSRPPGKRRRAILQAHSLDGGVG